MKLKQGIGANSGPAGFVHSFKCIRTRNTALPRFFADFICHVQHCVSHFVPLSPMKYGLCILFLLRSTSTQRLRPTRCFFGHLFFCLLHPLSSVLVLFCCQLCQFLFHLTFVIVSPSVTPHITLQSFWFFLCTTILRGHIVWNVAFQLSPHLI